jgi:hypothetical protein
MAQGRADGVGIARFRGGFEEDPFARSGLG